MKSYDEVDYLLLSEYQLLMRGQTLRRLDIERNIHMQAYMNLAVQETVTVGKKTYSKYPSFESFFNYEERKKEMFGIKEEVPVQQQNIKNLILLANKKGG